MSAILPAEITIKSSARLHMGFFDLHGGLGRQFGSIGLSVDAPGFQLAATRSEKLVLSGLVNVRLERIAEKLMAALNLSASVHLNVIENLPEHAGLGSGTQQALAVGTAISRLYGLHLPASTIAELTGRGARSGIGIAAFDLGGLLVDGGRVSSAIKTQSHHIPPLLARYDFPKEWALILILDHEQTGVHGQEELAMFEALPVFSESLAAHLCRAVLMQGLPALVERDLSAFGHCIQTLQMHTGDYFAPAQGGRYASPRVSAVLQYLEKMGMTCFGQSSWGPTGFAVFENETLANECIHKLNMNFANKNLSFMRCRANNKPAQVVAI